MDSVFGHSGQLAFLIGTSVVFDVPHSTLRSPGNPASVISLKPVGARVLSHFAEAPRTALSRQCMLDHNWRRFGMEVTENTLNQVVHALRAAFHEVDPATDYIRTIPRIGYALLTDVRPWWPHPMECVQGKPCSRCSLQGCV